MKVVSQRFNEYAYFEPLKSNNLLIKYRAAI